MLSLPYLGFVTRDDEAYKKTKQRLLSPYNPYYAQGPHFRGIGGPHVSPVDPWPMSLISAIFGSDDDKEILELLYTIVNVSKGIYIENSHPFDELY